MSPQMAKALLGALNWCEQQPECKHNLGIPRSQMPQLPFGGLDDFLQWMEAKYGVKSKPAMIEVGKLRATQKEINADKVERIASGGETIGGDPIPVSRDWYLLDGHHRWAASLSKNPRNRIKAVIIDMPIRALLKAANKYPGTFQVDFHDMPQGRPQMTMAYNYDRRKRR